MFEGEKTRLFWIGLTMLALASLVLFTILWYAFINSMRERYISFDWTNQTPQLVGAIIFILVGLYMMNSGVKKLQATSSTPKLL
jgi:putative Mn2+ efflux pump MntP